MKVTVKDFLNVRVGKPSVNAPTFQFLAPGSVLDVEESFFDGDPVEGNTLWVKDNAENYYWSGGIHAEHLVSIPVVPKKAKLNYNELINIPDKFKETKGKDIVVAIVDTGCSDHPALGDSVIAGFDILTGTASQFFDLSLDGHGTFLAGMIAARESNENEIVGVAPLVKLIIVKAAERAQVLGKNFLKGLEWLDKFHRPDIINISADLSIGDLGARFDTVFSSLTNKKTTLVAAGQNGALIYSNTIFYPAKNQHVVGVGCVDKAQTKHAQVNSQIDYIVSDFNFQSTSNFGSDYKNLQGSSMSTAFVSGALALILSWQKANGDQADPLTLLNESLQSLTPENIDKSLKLFKK